MPSGVLSSCRGDVEAIRCAHRLGIALRLRICAVGVADYVGKCSHSSLYLY